MASASVRLSEFGKNRGVRVRLLAARPRSSGSSGGKRIVSPSPVTSPSANLNRTPGIIRCPGRIQPGKSELVAGVPINPEAVDCDAISGPLRRIVSLRSHEGRAARNLGHTVSHTGPHRGIILKFVHKRSDAHFMLGASCPVGPSVSGQVPTPSMTAMDRLPRFRRGRVNLSS